MIAARLANIPDHRPERSGSIDLLISQPEAAQMMNVSVPSLKNDEEIKELRILSHRNYEYIQT
jgi:hypothetical protein